MKKLVSFVFMLVFLLKLTVISSAANMNVSINTDYIPAGDEVVITIALDSAIDASEGATMMQGELWYNSSLLEFQSVEKNAGLSEAAKHAGESKVQFHYLSMDATPVHFEAGTMAVVTFKAKEELSEETLQSAMKFQAYVQNQNGENLGSFSYTETPVSELHVHSWDAGTITKAATCKATGIRTYLCACGETKTEKIAKTTKHSYSAWKKISEATVFQAEVQKRTCSVCKASETQNVGKALKAVLELPGKLKGFRIKTGNSITFAISMANGDKISSVVSGNTKSLKIGAVAKTDGKIRLKGVKAGTTKLKITLASGKNRTYTVKVVNETVKTTSISVSNVSNQKLTLEKGKTFALEAVKVPFTSTQKITYASSNKNVATVTSSGTVKAVAAGKAVITVTSGGKKTSLTVTVPGITNLQSSVSIKKNKTLTLKPVTYGISGKVTYTSSNKNIVSVTSKGKIKGLKKGTAKITVKAGNFKKVITVKVTG